MLKKETRDLLKVLSPINSQMILSYPVTVIKSSGIQAVIDLSDFEDEFEEFGIYNINEFLTLVGSIEAADIELKSPKIIIKNSRQKIEYNTADVDILQENLQIKKDFLERVTRNTKVLSFVLNEEDIKQVKKISNLLSLEILKVVPNENKLVLRNDEKSSNTFEIDLGIGEETEEIDFNVSLFQKIPISNYDAEVYENPKGSKILVLTSQEIPELKILISPR